MIARREGIGACSAGHPPRRHGLGRLEDIAVHVKAGAAGYTPAAQGHGPGLRHLGPRGCHLRATFYKPELSGMIPPDQIAGKAELFLEFESRLTVFDTLVLSASTGIFYLWTSSGGDGPGDGWMPAKKRSRKAPWLSPTSSAD